MFTTAIVQKLTEVGATDVLLGEDEDSPDPTEEQQEVYEEFTRTVHEHLLKGDDPRGYEYGLTFGAQDDARGMCWGERTGIPLGKPQERWESLADREKHAALLPGDPLTQDPSATDEQFAN